MKTYVIPNAQLKKKSTLHISYLTRQGWLQAAITEISLSSILVVLESRLPLSITFKATLSEKNFLIFLNPFVVSKTDGRNL